MSVRLAVAGATGRMGQFILGLAAKDPAIEVTAALEYKGHAGIGKALSASLPQFKGSALLTSDPAQAFAVSRVLIDFTQPEASMEYLKAAVAKGAALVIGTTGFSDAQRAEIHEASKKIPLIQTYNYSVGMNLLFALVEEAAAKLGPAYDVEIIEAHHNQKKDAPSGSAIRLGEGVAKAWGKKLSDISVHGREGKVGVRKSGELGFHAVRGGDIVGDHTVLYAGANERLELRHQAHSREAFAQGALKAAAWLAGKPAGFYDMADVLGLKK